MLLKTYEFIKENLHLLEIDLENGKVLNRKEYANNGYIRISLNGKDIEVHKIMGVALFDKQVVNRVINHINGVKKDNRSTNLEVVSSKRNTQHAFELGLMQSKLTPSKVKQIKRLIFSGMVHSEIAKLFGVTETTIYLINKGETWNHIQVSSDYDYSKKPKKLSFSHNDIENIFKLYNSGHYQSEIAEIYNCSQTSIYRVLNNLNRFKEKGDYTVRKKFTTTLDSNLIKQLKTKAVNENTDVSKIIEKTLKEMFKNEKSN